MHSYRLCPSSDSYVFLPNISKNAVNAILVSEDGAFYDHHGFDWFEIKQTIEKNLSKFDYARGGSTITQQLAKNVFFSGEKTLSRKLREAVATYEIEKYFSKAEILERYLNVVEFGPDIFGIKAASKYYFGKSAGDLDIIESAFLAFLLPNPKAYHKNFAVKSLTPFARKRLVQIVGLMQRYRKISSEEGDQAINRLGGMQWLDSPAIEEEAPVNVDINIEDD